MKHSIKILCALSFALFSCSSTIEIPEDASAKQIIQGGQNEFSAGNYKNALKYYNTALERFGDSPEILVEAKYEIGHIYMKQKKYDAAENVFTEISSLYESNPFGKLPGSYRKLSQLELEKIAEIRAK